MSAQEDKMTAELKYTKDGIPIFDGNPDLFTAYQRAALVYGRGVEEEAPHRPPLAGGLGGAQRLPWSTWQEDRSPCSSMASSGDVEKGWLDG